MLIRRSPPTDEKSISPESQFPKSIKNISQDSVLATKIYLPNTLKTCELGTKARRNGHLSIDHKYQ